MSQRVLFGTGAGGDQGTFYDNRLYRPERLGGLHRNPCFALGLLYAQPMEKYSGTPIEAHQAWQMFDRWKSRDQEIGVIFWGRSANLYTLGRIASVKNGRVELKGESARASFNLTGAVFKYGPMQTWPNWPSPPIVEVNALRAEIPNGDYLALAEGLTPQSISSPLLPE